MWISRCLASCLFLPLASACVPTGRLAVAPEVASMEWSRPPPVPSVSREEGWNLGKALHSAEAERLIDQAKVANADIGAARARVSQARALLRHARGAMLPVVSASAGLKGTRTDRTGDPFDFSDAFGSIDISYDVDLFGSGRAETTAARQRLRAAQFDGEALSLTIESEVARAYVRRAALRSRIELLDRNIETARELERILRARMNAGDATRVDLGLQTIQLRQLETDRTRLEQALDQTRTALALLTGNEAPLFQITAAPLDSLTPFAAAVGQPSELLARRPDIRAAEARIAAAGGDVRAARAAFFPRIRLSASAIAQAASLSGPLGTTLAIGGDLLAPIFNRGRLRANFELASAQQTESVQLYRNTLLSALAEVEDALSAVDRSAAREKLLIAVVEEAQVTARLARLQYLGGDADLQYLFDAEQRLTEAQDARAVALQERLEAAIDLYRALGG